MNGYELIQLILQNLDVYGIPETSDEQQFILEMVCADLDDLGKQYEKEAIGKELEKQIFLSSYVPNS